MPTDPLPPLAVAAINVIGWPVVHFSIAWLANRIPAAAFRPDGWLYRPRRWERSGRTYERLLGVRAWKDLLPDAGGWTRGGFAKSALGGADEPRLRRFLAETCRGELAHWLMLFAGALFLPWNPPWADAVTIAYALLANLPCIVVQRHTRARLVTVLCKRRVASRDVVAAE